MRDPRDIVSINDALADGSAAYLAMWSALESFNPEGDRWSEPFDFGSRDERIKNAENAIARFHETVKRSDPQVSRDVETFRKYVRALAEGLDFSEAIRGFSLSLRQRGSELADESVRLVRAKPTDTDSNS
jgi:hypothetical protein